MFFSLPLWQNHMENLYAPFEGVSNIFFIFIFFIGGVSHIYGSCTYDIEYGVKICNFVQLLIFIWPKGMIVL